MNHPVRILSLGPGDPELVTIKTLRQLQESDRIYVPATRHPATGRLLSRAASILSALDIPGERIRPFELPMEKGRTRAREAYRRLALAVGKEQAAGGRVAVVAEGDAGLYASVHYVGDLLRDAGVEVAYTPGIPAFIASAAAAGLHLVKGEESLLVLPSVGTAGELLAAAGEHTTVVMKLSQSERAVREAIARGGEFEWRYFENVGTDREFLTDAPEEILRREFPYFSLLVVRRPTCAAPPHKVRTVRHGS